MALRHGGARLSPMYGRPSPPPSANDPFLRVCEARYVGSGPSMPIYMTSPNGKYVRRYWAHRSAEWCDACQEPIAQWLQHMGRMDHSLLDMHYNAMADYPHRRWSAADVLDQAQRRYSRRHGEGFMKMVTLSEAQRRDEITAMICRLRDAGLLTLGRMSLAFNAAHGPSLQGSMVQYRLLPQIILAFFPNASVGALSDAMCFVLSNYNMETVYDLCSLQAVDEAATDTSDADELTPFMSRTAQWSASDESEGGSGGSGEGGESSGDAGVAFSRKAGFLRGVLGQLRFLFEDRDHPLGTEVAEWHRVVAMELCRAIVVESFFVRSCEYSVRMDAVWRSKGCEQLRADAPLHAPASRSGASQPLPRPIAEEAPRYTCDPPLRWQTHSIMPPDPRTPRAHLNL
jgi:hypothetical protein